MLITEVAHFHKRHTLYRQCKAFLMRHSKLLIHDDNLIGKHLEIKGILGEVWIELQELLTLHPQNYLVALRDSMGDSKLDSLHENEFPTFAPPICNGHTCTIVNGRMIVLGGRHSNRLYSCRYLLLSYIKKKIKYFKNIFL